MGPTSSSARPVRDKARSNDTLGFPVIIALGACCALPLLLVTLVAWPVAHDLGAGTWAEIVGGIGAAALGIVLWRRRRGRNGACAAETPLQRTDPPLPRAGS